MVTLPPILLAASLSLSPEAGSAASRWSRIDAVVGEAIQKGELPGAVVLVGRGDRVAFRKAYGDRAVLARERAV